MQALKTKLNGHVRFAGVGGPRMKAVGMDILFPQEELAHFGLFELLRHIPHLLKRMRQTEAEVRRLCPAALITIDAPDFCFRVAKKLKDAGIPLIHYVAPTVWAWRPKRAKKVAQFLNHLLALLPFEPPYFAREGLECTFVGHPIVEGEAAQGDAERFRATFKIQGDTPLIMVLPGSRMSEITRLMPIFGATVRFLKKQHPDLQAVIPIAPGKIEVIKSLSLDWEVPIILTENDKDKYDAMAAVRAALACSGTVAVELAMAGLPAVIAYKVSALTAFLYRRLIKIKYANLVNLMHDKMVVPEMIQKDCTPEKLSRAMHELLSSSVKRQTQIDGLGTVAGWLGHGQFIPSEHAADTVMAVVKKWNEKR